MPHRTVRLSLAALVLILALLLPGLSLAQGYSFQVPQELVNAYWNADGSLAIDYVFVFQNDVTAGPIEYVDLGLPNDNYDIGSIQADVDGHRVTDISRSGYEGSGSGVAIALGPWSIQPGETGQVHVFVGRVERVLHPDSKDSNYASAVFSPTWFKRSSVQGATNMTMSFHLPPGVKPDEPRWHTPPSGFPAEPATSLDQQGRVTYTWQSSTYRAVGKANFGASFPKTYVPAASVSNPSIFEQLNISPDAVIGCLVISGAIAFVFLISAISVAAGRKRKLQYLPPKISIEGHGIKRGLTAIEAAILLEEPLDKILTMILFAVVKKGAATVESKDPLKLTVASPLPDGLYPYEQGFLQAFAVSGNTERRRLLQDMMIDLVKSVSQKMKGFSRRETIGYYQDIMRRAWAEVEAAGTPEVKSQKYNEVMEWTMLDKEYERRTQDVFRTGPVFVPVWWPRYDPVYRRTTGGGTIGTPAPSIPGGGISLPHLPGSDFAASVVNSVQNFSSSVIGNLTDFTSNVTNKTNPIPVQTSSSRGGFHGGGGCACACACAGCACACAGGGR